MGLQSLTGSQIGFSEQAYDVVPFEAGMNGFGNRLKRRRAVAVGHKLRLPEALQRS